MLTVPRRTRRFPDLARCCTFLRTHGVALDWLFDRINLDPKIHIEYVDTKHQLADVLTKGNFTRDEWNKLLHLFNISHSSLTSCTKRMSEMMQEQEGEDRIVAKSKPTTMNQAFIVSTSSSSVQNPVASKSLEILKAPCRTDWSSSGKLDARDFNRDAASSSQGWQKDAVLDVRTWKLVTSGNSETEGSDKIWPHNLHVSTNYVPLMEVFSILRQRCGLGPMGQMKHLDVNTAIWVYFCLSLFKAAVHLGTDNHREFTIYQESTQEIFETVISSDSEVDN